MDNKKSQLQSSECLPRWCKYCRHFGEYAVWYVCYRPLLVRLKFFQPQSVPYDGCCEHFKLAKRYTTKQKNR